MIEFEHLLTLWKWKSYSNWFVSVSTEISSTKLCYFLENIIPLYTTAVVNIPDDIECS